MQHVFSASATNNDVDPLTYGTNVVLPLSNGKLSVNMRSFTGIAVHDFYLGRNAVPAFKKTTDSAFEIHFVRVDAHVARYALSNVKNGRESAAHLLHATNNATYPANGTDAAGSHLAN